MPKHLYRFTMPCYFCDRPVLVIQHCERELEFNYDCNYCGDSGQLVGMPPSSSEAQVTDE